MSERCTHCHLPIEDIPVFLPKLVCKRTFSIPVEYEEFPFHVACAETVTSADYQAYCEEQAAMRGLSDEERERI